MPGPAEPDPLPPGGLSRDGEALLSSLDSVRDLLTRRMVQEHHAITDPDLNYCVISSLLLILFIRAGQECGLAKPGTLSGLLAGDGIAGRMEDACSGAGLTLELFFEKGADGPRDIPRVSGAVLGGIITRLDMPGVPAPLTGLPLEEFAAVMDHFLGTRVQVTEGYRVTRTGKSALLYTGTIDVPPQEVIGQVVSGVLERITGRPGKGTGSPVRILDPACGAGLFLLAAYRALVRKKTRLPGHPGPGGEPLQALIRESVFGTDIDPESVSAARFVLLLAFIEEYQKSCGQVPAPDQVREVCACLVQNIRCGNSLIAPDYFARKPVFPFNADERRKVNPFAWPAAFPGITEVWGFDAVIGAPPPYRPFAVKSREEYFQMHYAVYSESAGLYGYFIGKGLSLLRPGGILSFLVPGTFLRSRPARPLRRLLLSKQIEAITGTGRTRQLPEGTARVYVLTLSNEPPTRPFLVTPWVKGTRPYPVQEFLRDQSTLDDGGWRLEDTRVADLLEKIRKSGTPLDHYLMGEIDAGIYNEENDSRVVDTATRNRLTEHSRECRTLFVPLLGTGDIRRYVPGTTGKFVFLARGRSRKKCRALVALFEKMMKEKSPESGPAKDNGCPDKARPKIIFSERGQSPAFCFDAEGRYAITRDLRAIQRNDLFLLGILNSSLGRFVITHTSTPDKQGCYSLPAALSHFPVYVPDFEKLADKTRHARMVALVSHILGLTRYLPQVKTDQERRLVQQDIDATDVRIDALAGEIYGLTADEIAVVEGTPSANL